MFEDRPERTCNAHPSAPAVGMCHQCHKPYCTKCRLKTPLGEFCCFECSGKYAAFKATWKDPKLKFPWFGAFVTSAILLAALALGVAWVGNRVLGISALRPFDFITRFTR
jgi:hypothetical protein